MGKESGRQLKISEIFGRYKYVLLVAVLGAFLLLLPKQESAKSDAAPTYLSDESSDIRQLEREMEEILSKMSGVGRVDVMLTVESGGELVLATDSTLRYSGSPQRPDDYDRSNETVTVSGGNGTEVVVTQERSAKFRGALIVCDGGDNDAVRLKILEAVCALTGLGSDRVAVVRWGTDTSAVKTAIENGEEVS